MTVEETSTVRDEDDASKRKKKARPESLSIDEESGESGGRGEGGNGGPQGDPQRREPLLVGREKRIGARQQTIFDVANAERSIEARVGGHQSH